MFKMDNKLSSHPLFTVPVEFMGTEQRVALSYQRAKLILDTYKFTAHDILECTDKYWALQMDPIWPHDIACFTIVSAHVGLAIGTLARHAKYRADLQSLLASMLRFETVGLYLLTERGHGLDAFNIETTATLTSNGFILNTPREEAVKFMPATTPSGMPKVALVVAKLIVDGADRGSRTFIVPICNDTEMYRGVSSTRLPPRSGTAPLDFSLTKFTNVHLPLSALLGPVAVSSTDSHASWWDEVSRIPIGTLAVAGPLVQATKQVAYIGGKYSLRRKIMGKGGVPIPIISFASQQWPVLRAVATGQILEAWYPKAVQQLQDPGVDQRVKHGISVIYKTTVCRQFQLCVREMAERCGAQGSFEQNFMSRIECDSRGTVIAEGDILTLSIRLFSELLLGRYAIPIPTNSQSLLVRHARSFLEENSRLASTLPGGHRGDAFNSLMLPQAELGITSIGHALAYCAAADAGVPQPLLDIYECAVMRLDPAWYSEKLGISAHDQRLRDAQALSSALPHLEKYLHDLNVEKYVTAPIIDDDKWVQWIDGLSSFRGDAIPRANGVPEAALGQTMAHL